MRDNEKGGALTEVTFFVLLALHTPRHGYAVMRFIEDATDGRLTLGAGTLYGAVNNLLSRGWIEPCGEDAERKKTYTVTEAGRQAAKKELARLRELSRTAQRIIEEE